MDCERWKEKTAETLWRRTERERNMDRINNHAELASAVRRFCGETVEREEQEGYFGFAVNLAARRAEIRQITNETVLTMLPDLTEKTQPESVPALPDWSPLTDPGFPENGSPGRREEEKLAGRLRTMEKESDRRAMLAADSLFGGEAEGSTAVVINPYPIRRAMFTCIPSHGPLRVFDGDRELPAQYIGGDGATAVELEMDGFSIRSLRLEETGVPCETVPMAEDGFAFDSGGMHVKVLPDGSITEYHSPKYGNVLKAPGGNILEADLAQKDGSRRRIIGKARGAARIERGPLFDNVLIDGTLGNSPYTMIMYLPRSSSQRVEIMAEIRPSAELEQAMKRPGSEIRCVWHCAEQQPEILADSPLGKYTVSPGEPFFCANGCTLTRNGYGVMYDHQGITQARFEDGKLINIWAEGGKNAMESLPAGALDAASETDPTAQNYRFFYAIDLTDTADPGSMFSRILYYQIPLFPFRTKKPAPAKTLFSLRGTELIFTSALRRGNRVFLRMWNAADRRADLRAEGIWKLRAVLGEDGRERKGDFFAEPGEFVWLVIDPEKE